jgi:hypothetical protein
MKKVIWVFSGLLICTGAYASSKLYDEFRSREEKRLTQEQGNAINFLKVMKYPVAKIVELEVLDVPAGAFVLRDHDDIVCFGDPKEKILRCKNSMGLTTVNYQGDAD